MMNEQRINHDTLTQEKRRGKGSDLQAVVMHSFTDDKGRRWTACCECNRGGNGNDPDKCSCGWQRTTWDTMGCFLGADIVGEPKKPLSRAKRRAKERYRRWLEYGDRFDTFRDFLSWDAEPERSWNGGGA